LPGAGDWPAFQVKHLRRHVEGKARRKAGVILQYDMMRRLLVPSFCDDPAIMAVSHAAKVTLVLVAAHAGVLAKRLTTRHLRRAEGLPERVPLPGFSPRVWALNQFGRAGDRTRSAMLKSRLVERKWSSFRGCFDEWPWSSLQTYLRSPDRIEAMTAELVEAVAAHARKNFTVIEVRPAPYRGDKIGWLMKSSPMRAKGRARGSSAASTRPLSSPPFPLDWRLPTSGP
jgi:hypothetical protein